MADIKDIHEGATVLGEFGIKVVGQVESSSDLPDPTEYEGEYGDAYVVGEEAPYDYYIFTRPFEDVDDPQWFNLGQFPAPGPQGETGETGATGATPAITATATTSTLSSGQDASVSITKTGTDEEPHFTFAFEIPQGVQGIQGVQGAQGIQGPQGPQGIQGQKGDTGYLYTIIGQVNNESSLPLPGQVGRTSAFLVGSQEPYDVYIIIGQDIYDLEWLNIGPIATVVPTTYVASVSDASSGTLDATTLAAINNETNIHYMRVGSELYEFANKYNGNAYYMSLRYDSSTDLNKVARFVVALSSGAWTTGEGVTGYTGVYQVKNQNNVDTSSITLNSTLNGKLYESEDHGGIGNIFMSGLSGTSNITSPKGHDLNGINYSIFLDNFSGKSYQNLTHITPADRSIIISYRNGDSNVYSNAWSSTDILASQSLINGVLKETGLGYSQHNVTLLNSIINAYNTTFNNSDRYVRCVVFGDNNIYSGNAQSSISNNYNFIMGGNCSLTKSTDATKQNRFLCGNYGTYSSSNADDIFMVGAGASGALANCFAAGNDGTSDYIKIGDTKLSENSGAVVVNSSMGLTINVDEDSSSIHIGDENWEYFGIISDSYLDIKATDAIGLYSDSGVLYVPDSLPSSDTNDNTQVWLNNGVLCVGGASLPQIYEHYLTFDLLSNTTGSNHYTSMEITYINTDSEAIDGQGLGQEPYIGDLFQTMEESGIILIKSIKLISNDGYLKYDNPVYINDSGWIITGILALDGYVDSTTLPTTAKLDEQSFDDTVTAF